jgi:hypothetical protein
MSRALSFHKNNINNHQPDITIKWHEPSKLPEKILELKHPESILLIKLRGRQPHQLAVLKSPIDTDQGPLPYEK